VAPEVCLGDPAAEYPLGDPAVEITFGVPVGVRRGVIYGVKENLCPEYLEAIGAKRQEQKGITMPVNIKHFFQLNSIVLDQKSKFLIFQYKSLFQRFWFD